MINLYEKRSLRTLCSEVFVLIVTAFVYSVAFPGLVSEKGLGFIAFFALIPVFTIIKNTSWKAVGFHGFLFGVAFYCFYNYWLPNFHKGAIVIVTVIKGGEMVRDEVGGGYGDTSSIPRLTPEAVPGAAAAAALTAGQEIQRETITGVVPTPPVEQPATARPAAAQDAVEPSAQGAPWPPAVATPPEERATAAGPRTTPIVIPEVEVAELGMADRLGLSRDDDEEVGPTS